MRSEREAHLLAQTLVGPLLDRSRRPRPRSASSAQRRFAPFDYWRRMLRIGSKCCVGNLPTGCSWRSAPHKSRSGIPTCSGCLRSPDRHGSTVRSLTERTGTIADRSRAGEGPRGLGEICAMNAPRSGARGGCPLDRHVALRAPRDDRDGPPTVICGRPLGKWFSTL